MQENFVPETFYASYAPQILLRPGYPARAQYKSTIMWQHFGNELIKQLGKVESYADIGGCFGANCLAFHISKAQNDHYPNTKIFELTDEYNLGKDLFPYIEFISTNILKYSGTPAVFDLFSLFDVIEHIEEPENFLSDIAHKCRFALTMTPLETKGDWRGGGYLIP